MRVNDAEAAVPEADEREGRAIMSDGEDVAVVFDATAVARNRLRVDTRKWIAARILPKRYGDKVQQEHTGPNGSSLFAGIQVSFVRPDQG